MLSFVLLALVSVASAGLPALISTGTSQQFRTQDVAGNYAFGYNEGGAGGGTFRKETGDAWGNKAGAYGLQLADGRMRTVNYVADAGGFRANIQTNEPGVAPEDPANVHISKPVPVIAAPIIAAPAPQHIAAPLVAASSLAYGHGGHGFAGYGSSLNHGYAGFAGNLNHGYGGLNHGYGGLNHGYGGLNHGYGSLNHGYGGLAGNLYNGGLAAPYGYGGGFVGNHGKLIG